MEDFCASDRASHFVDNARALTKRVLAMKEAENKAGCGFYNEPEWLANYERAIKTAEYMKDI